MFEKFNNKPKRRFTMENQQEVTAVEEPEMNLTVVESEPTGTITQTIIDTAATLVVGIVMATVISYGVEASRKVINGQAAKLRTKIQERKAQEEAIIIDQN
jgi:hypothetical protein